MRLLRTALWIAAGGAAVAWVARAAAERTPSNRADDDVGVDPEVAPDPRDPVQSLDDAVPLHTEELELDAMSRADAEAASDLAMLSTDFDEREGFEEVMFDSRGMAEVHPDAVPADRMRDVGELYGVHTPAAADRDLPDGDASFEVGQNWLESLQTAATEFGPEDEEEIDLEDEHDKPPHPTDTRDIPVADRGAAGPRGV